MLADKQTDVVYALSSCWFYFLLKRHAAHIYTRTLVFFFYLSGHKVQGDRSSFDGKLPFTFWWLFVLFHCAAHWMDRDHYPLTLPLSLTFFSVKKKKKKKICRGERKTFLGPGCFQNWNPMVRYAGQSQNCQPPYTTTTLSVLLHPREEEGQRELHGGGYYREYPAGALRQWFNCQFPQGISFPPDLFLFFSYIGRHTLS